MDIIREDCIYARQSVDRKDSISIESQIDFQRVAKLYKAFVAVLFGIFFRALRAFGRFVRRRNRLNTACKI